MGEGEFNITGNFLKIFDIIFIGKSFFGMRMIVRIFMRIWWGREG
jgi:hypothetical protein